MNPFKTALVLIFTVKFCFVRSVNITTTIPSIVRTGNGAIPRTPLTMTITSFGNDGTISVIVVPEIVAAISHSTANFFSQIAGVTKTQLTSTSVITGTVNGDTIVYETINYYAVPSTASMIEPTNIYSTIIVDICPSCVIQESFKIEEVELYTSYFPWSKTFVTTYSTFETSQPGTQITTYYVKTPYFNETSYTTTGWSGSFVNTYSTASYLTTGDDGYDTYYTFYYIETPDQAITSYTTTGWTGTIASTYSTFTTFVINDSTTIYSTLYYIETPYFNETSYTTTGWTGSFVNSYSTASYLTTGDNGYYTYYTLYYIETPSISKLKLTTSTIKTSLLQPVINKDSISMKGSTLPFSIHTYCNSTKKSSEALKINRSNKTINVWATNTAIVTKVIFTGEETSLNTYQQSVLRSWVLSNTTATEIEYSSNYSATILATRLNISNITNPLKSIYTSLSSSSTTHISIYYGVGLRFSLSKNHILFGLLFLM